MDFEEFLHLLHFCSDTAQELRYGAEKAGYLFAYNFSCGCKGGFYKINIT